MHNGKRYMTDTTTNNMNYKMIPDPHKNLVIPESWSDVQAFAEWWLASGTPIIVKKGTEVFLSDDATATCLFRKGRFQVEMYLIHPQPLVPEHEHPGVEVIKMPMGFRDHFSLSSILKNGESHGAGTRMAAETLGYPLIAFQHWLTRDPTTIASMWKGPTVGPKHEALIRRFNPNAYVVDGYADITRCSV
jgi:hypothetical protein